jgi:hypothetical protein
MALPAGTLVFVSVECTRTGRYRTLHQTESHRTPRYRVQYQLEGQPTHDAMVGPNSRRYRVANIRESKPGDIVQVTLTEDGDGIVDWRNKTSEEFLRDLDGLGGEVD